jgi:hypothetical protein
LKTNITLQCLRGALEFVQISYVKYPGQALTREAAQRIFVSWWFEDFEHHFAFNHFGR